MNRNTNAVVAAFVVIIVAVILIAPIFLYVHTFGANLSLSHERWAEMGSAMAGIYTPILSLLTLVVLINQVYLQGKVNEHNYDQCFIQEGRADLQSILVELGRMLADENFENLTLQEYLNKTYAFEFKGVAINGSVHARALSLKIKFPQLFLLWGAVYPILAGLKAVKKFPYEHNYASALQKAVYFLSF